MNNVNNYYGAVIIKDTVELRKLLMEHRPTSMELIYEWNRELTSLNISTENKNYFYYEISLHIMVGTNPVFYSSIIKCKFRGKDGVTYQYSV